MKEKRGGSYFLAVILFIFLISYVSASYEFSNHSIETHYSKGSTISGNINISFENESLNSFFEDSFDNKVYLKDLLGGSNSYLYNCTSKKCSSSYVLSNPSSSKTFSLPKGEEKTFGFVIQGNIQNINSVSFLLSSTAPASDLNQIKIDILDDGIIDAGNSKAGTASQNVNYGCYNASEGPNEINLITTPFCQNITVYESPGLLLGGFFKKVSDGSNGIGLNIYNKKGVSLGSCRILNSSVSFSGGNYFCSVNVSIPETNNYYICAYAEQGEAKYKTLGYSSLSSGKNCGFLGYLSFPPQNETAAYKIGLTPLKFSSPSALNISNVLPTGDLISLLIGEYLSKTYPEGCLEGCKIPLKLVSFEDQSITLNSLKVSYDAESLPGLEISTFYDFDIQDSKVSSPMQLLPLDGFFYVSQLGWDENYTLKFKGEKLFSEKIFLENFSIQIYPLRYAVNFSVPFLILNSQDAGSQYYEIDFGDNSISTTSSKSFLHKYISVGNFSLKVSSYINGTKLTKTFKIEILPSKNFIDNEIKIQRSSISFFNSQISFMNSFEKSEINRIFELENLTTTLNSIESSVSLASSDSDYEKIFGNLIRLNIPKSITRTVSQEIPFIIEVNEINLDILKDITEGDYSPADESADYISFWDYENLNSKISSNNILVETADGSKVPLNFYEISISPKKNINQSYYFIFPNSGNANFEENSGVEAGSGYSYFELGNIEKTIRFSTGEDFGSYHPFFIAPQNVEVFAGGDISEPMNNNWILILVILGVILIGFLTYYIMHRWYAVKYENYLFPDKNHLYNAIFYINNSLKNGMEESEIRKSLLDAGWKNEQVVYLIKKHSGKNPGMFNLFGSSSEKGSSKINSPPKPGRNVNYKDSNTKFNK